MTSKIEWTDETWNPVTGCTKVSAGCQHCYAERMARRLAGRYGYPEAPNHFDVTLHPERLEQPLRWKKSRTVFVCSMGDLFHEGVSLMFVRDVWAIFARTRHHTYQVLTKRPKRMLEFVQQVVDFYGEALPNVWLGVTAENQVTADERISILLQTPAAVRFVSAEPLLGAVDLSGPLNGMPEPYSGGHRGYVTHDMAIDAGEPEMEGMDLGWEEPEWQQTVPALDWLITGGESGPGARPMHPDWVRSLRDQCQAAGVPFFFKCWGACMPYNGKGASVRWTDGTTMLRVGKKVAGRLLDERTWDEFPCWRRHNETIT